MDKEAVKKLVGVSRWSAICERVSDYVNYHEKQGLFYKYYIYETGDYEWGYRPIRSKRDKIWWATRVGCRMHGEGSNAYVWLYTKGEPR